MKRSGWAVVAAWALALPLGAQTSSIDQLEKDLNQLKQQREESSTQSLTNLLDQLGAAANNPNAALDLFQKAGGDLPDATPVDSRYEHETPTEKDERLAKDDAAIRDFASIVQLHAGLLRFAVLFIAKPDEADLQKDWTAWLKNSALIYGGLTTKHKLKRVKLKESIFDSYFGFTAWRDSSQGDWTVADIPDLFRKTIIDSLRQAHSPDLLSAWDLYIAMRSVDQPDENIWRSQELPFLQFEKASDDFNLLPNAGKLAALVDIIKNNPGNNKLDEMITRTRKMMQDFRGEAPADTNAPPPGTDSRSPAAPDPNPNATSAPDVDPHAPAPPAPDPSAPAPAN